MRPLKINGKTQFPQLPVGDGLGDGDGDGEGLGVVVGVGDGVGDGESPQVADSSPIACIANLLLSSTAALLDTPAMPIGVPVGAYILSGLE